MPTKRKGTIGGKLEPEDGTGQERIRLRIEWQQPEGVQTSYVTNFTIQEDGPNFILSFYEIKPPIFIGPDQNQLARVRKLHSIKAEYVARLVVTEERLREFIQVTTDYLEREHRTITVVDEENS
jgi:hypothetical protein